MKGPGERRKYDLRRLWECPQCKRRERTPGSAASRLCLCQIQKIDGRPIVMKLIEDGVQRLVPPVVIEHAPLEPRAILVVEESPAVSDGDAGGPEEPPAEPPIP